MTYNFTEEYDIIVIGAGHAGVEASLAASRMGCKVLLATINIEMLAFMPCNPSIGGSAKGIVVREVDALGGEMAKTIDKTYIQMKMLNTGKGPAVRALRAQADKELYSKEMRKTVENQENLTLRQTMIDEIFGGRWQGCRCSYSDPSRVCCQGCYRDDRDCPPWGNYHRRSQVFVRSKPQPSFD